MGEPVDFDGPTGAPCRPWLCRGVALGRVPRFPLARKRARTPGSAHRRSRRQLAIRFTQEPAWMHRLRNRCERADWGRKVPINGQFGSRARVPFHSNAVGNWQVTTITGSHRARSCSVFGLLNHIRPNDTMDLQTLVNLAIGGEGMKKTSPLRNLRIGMGQTTEFCSLGSICDRLAGVLRVWAKQCQRFAGADG